jgi:general L-amino acid transport system permease protein
MAPSSHRGGPVPGRLARARVWVRRNFLSDPLNAGLTLIAALIVYALVPPIVRWALLDAAWSGGPGQCQVAAGACWPLVADKFRTLMVGTYPAELLWRPALAAGVLAAGVALTVWRRPRLSRLAILWAAVPVVYVWLVGGGLGLTPVDLSRWGGLMLTLMLATIGIVASVPLGILLALARRSRAPVLRALAVGIIEPVRGVPVITLLFMATIMLPLVLPDRWDIPNLLRVQFALIVFSSAYMAEVVRGGLQAIPRGQIDAAQSIGLGRVHTTLLVVLPQALTIVVPPLIGRCIALFKDTSLVIIVGLLDFVGMARAATRDPAWPGHGAELYLFVAFVYWAFCYSMSRYGRAVEARQGRG